MKWTPIKEGPPKKEGFYLVQSKYRWIPFIVWFGVDPMYPHDDNNCDKRFWLDDFADFPALVDMKHILAWMPLPKPYKEEKNENQSERLCEG